MNSKINILSIRKTLNRQIRMSTAITITAILICPSILAAQTLGFASTDWTDVDLSSNTAKGILNGTRVTLSGGRLTYGVTNGTFTAFNSSDFTPPLTASDTVEFTGSSNQPVYVVSFGEPVSFTACYPPGLDGVDLQIVVEEHGADYCWRASWGVLPDYERSFALGPIAPGQMPSQPLLTNDYMVIETHGYITAENQGVERDMYFETTNLVPVDPLIIEFEVQYVSGTVSQFGRAPIFIGFAIAPHVLGLLGIVGDGIFLSKDVAERYTSAGVSTDNAFHSYRIEVDHPMTAAASSNQVRVYQDGSFVMAGPMGGTGGNALTTGPDIFFGDGTQWAESTQRWRSLRHNAARLPSRPVMFIRRPQTDVCWTSCSNTLYNLQYCSYLSKTNWLNLFTNVVGNGDINCITDAGLGTEPQRFYRIQVVR